MESIPPQFLAVVVAVVVLVLAIVVALVLRRRPPAVETRERPETVEPTAPTASLPAPAPAPKPVERPRAAPVGFMAGLARTRERLSGSLRRIFGGGIDEATLEALEEDLIAADVGVRTAGELVQAIRTQADPDTSPREVLARELRRRLGATSALHPFVSRPHVILVVGVNGSGKTTTIGKLAARFRAEGRTVVLGAGDTFRAGAIEQLKVWGERAGAHVVAQQEGADPAAVAFDAAQAARAKDADVMICDTAGRLQSQKPLMDELGKVVRTIRKAIPDAPHEVLLVLDATIGQNALSQARTFKEVVGVTGVILTKLDGTAKGGIVVAVAAELGLPVKLLGLGEKIDDLRDFEPALFVEALLGSGEPPDEPHRPAGPSPAPV
jgi:fused signal recognition particle receptor